MEIAFFAGRVIAGIYFLTNAYSHLVKTNQLAGYASMKGVQQPKLAVFVSGILLLLGGFSVLFNMYLPIGIFLLIIFLLPVTFLMHAFWKEKNPHIRSTEYIQFMKNMALVGLLLMLLGVLSPIGF